MTDIDRIGALTSGDRMFLADGGLETDMIFNRGFDLPLFSSITLMDDARGRQGLRDYFEDYIRIARNAGMGMLLDTPTWRASHGWAEGLGRSVEDLDADNIRAVEFIAELRADAEDGVAPILINGVIGPHGDGYNPDQVLSADAYAAYHARQVRVLSEAGVDLISAMTITSSNEGLGIARAAQAQGTPCVVSFTVETDGRLPTGETLGEAIGRVDRETGGWPLFYMINCAHPDHFSGALSGDWLGRIGAVRANASRMSHAELDQAEELDAGNPVELAQGYVALRAKLPALRVMGGCCGTDHRHVGAIAHACHGHHERAA